MIHYKVSFRTEESSKKKNKTIRLTFVCHMKKRVKKEIPNRLCVNERNFLQKFLF
jgi:hypothetical protein